jgi:hypothetical protein
MPAFGTSPGVHQPARRRMFNRRLCASFGRGVRTPKSGALVPASNLKGLAHRECPKLRIGPQRGAVTGEGEPRSLVQAHGGGVAVRHLQK